MGTTLYLIRHGSIDYKDRVPGWLQGISLSDYGRVQARWIADYLRNSDIVAIYSSPLERAVQTAAPLAAQCQLSVNIIPDLTEIDFGEWQGRSFDELESHVQWKQFHSFRNGTLIPDGELMVEVQRRMVCCVEKICKEHAGQAVALVSHNDPIKSLLAFYAGVSLDLFHRIAVDTGSVSELSIENNQYLIKKVNITSGIPLSRV
ncbi:MAG: histidine phosphatase family protein [Fibrobacter sp.]|nr:histidine phosphatase family protein [Fibrobacter sp.]